jgi:hypothetical protein
MNTTTHPAELTGDALGFAVALIEYPEWKEQGYLESGNDLYFDDGEHYAPWQNWAQGGPIIEREGITISKATNLHWVARDRADEIHTFGRTPLIAAMRCHAVSKLGYAVDIPAELTNEVQA